VQIKFRKKILCVVVLACAATFANAEPTSPATTIVWLRPYQQNNAVFLRAAFPPTTFCSTSDFMIDVSTASGKAMFAAALAAQMGGKQVALEAVSTACGGSPYPGVNLLQSLYVYN